jgi:hypothetical protein
METSNRANLKYVIPSNAELQFLRIIERHITAGDAISRRDGDRPSRRTNQRIRDH